MYASRLKLIGFVLTQPIVSLICYKKPYLLIGSKQKC
jgi:hypothetical protein